MNTSITTDKEAEELAEELSDKLSEAATEIAEDNKSEAIQLLMEVDAGMEALENYLGIESFDHSTGEVKLKS